MNNERTFLWTVRQSDNFYFEWQSDLRHRQSHQSPETLLHYLHRFSNFTWPSVVCLNSELSSFLPKHLIFSCEATHWGLTSKSSIFSFYLSNSDKALTILKVSNSISKGFIYVPTAWHVYLAYGRCFNVPITPHNSEF